MLIDGQTAGPAPGGENTSLGPVVRRIETRGWPRTTRTAPFQQPAGCDVRTGFGHRNRRSNIRHDASHSDRDFTPERFERCRTRLQSKIADTFFPGTNSVFGALTVARVNWTRRGSTHPRFSGKKIRSMKSNTQEPATGRAPGIQNLKPMDASPLCYGSGHHELSEKLWRALAASSSTRRA